MNPPCGEPILWGISPDFSGLSPCYRWIAYVLLTRAPVADKGIATSSLPLDLHVLGLSLAFILSQDQTLRCIFFILYYTFEALPDRIDFFLSYFTVLHLLLQFLQWTWQKFPGAYPVSSFAVAKLIHFPTPFQIFFNVFLNYFSMKWKLFLFQIVITKIFLPLHKAIKVIWNANAISRL